jgi:N-acyl-D-amino-acid deacylase
MRCSGFTRRSALKVLAASAAAASPVQALTAAPGPRVLDDFLESFVRNEGVAGASLAVTVGSRLVYARGCGHADLQTQAPVRPDSLFRIASITKAITAAATLRLVEMGRFRLDTRLADVLPVSRARDPRWHKVTVLHLLRHAGGWSSEKMDPMFSAGGIARDLGVGLPITGDHVLEYMLAQPLAYEPGSEFSYSNFGYFLLGRMIEAATGGSYETCVRREILAPLGIRRMVLGRTPASARAPHEVSYYSSHHASAVVGEIGASVPVPYGAWSLELMAANGGWIASAADIARFAAAFDRPDECPILGAASIATMHAQPEGAVGAVEGGNYPACGWFVWPDKQHPHRAYASSNGLLEGSSTYLMRRHDGINWVVLFNGRNAKDGRPLMVKFRDASSDAFKSIAAWPEDDLFPRLL